MCLSPWVEGAQCQPALNILVATWLERSLYLSHKNRKMSYFEVGIWLFFIKPLIMAAATQQLHNVLELSYEWMDIQTVTHRLLPSFHHSFPSITIFFFLVEMMTSVSFGWKQSGEWCSSFSPLPQASIKGLRAPGSISTLCSSKKLFSSYWQILHTLPLYVITTR